MKRPLKDIRVAGWFLLVVLLLGGASWWAWHEYITEPPYVDPARFPIKGFDMSAHNGYANLDAAAKDGYEFVFLKASEGEDFRDENFVLNYNKARHAGLKVGAYHFFRFGVDGVRQGENFMRVLGPRPLDLDVVIDVEDQGNTKGIAPDSIRYELQRMTEYLNLKGLRVMYYSNRAGQEKYLLPDFEGTPLWICNFNEDNAANSDWTFWQYNHKGKVAGVRGNVDINVFHGNRREWEQYLNSAGKRGRTL